MQLKKTAVLPSDIMRSQPYNRGYFSGVLLAHGLHEKAPAFGTAWIQVVLGSVEPLQLYLSKGAHQTEARKSLEDANFQLVKVLHKTQGVWAKRSKRFKDLPCFKHNDQERGWQSRQRKAKNGKDKKQPLHASSIWLIDHKVIYYINFQYSTD